MFCSKCGTETPDDSQFCRECGRGLSAVSSANGAAAAVAPAPISVERKKNRKAFWALLVVAGLVIYWATTSRSPGAQQVQQLVKQQHTQSISNPSQIVAATAYSYFKMDVPQGASSVHLQGSFTANGGSGNDIEVLVVSEQEFLNWQNRHPAKTFYNSGKVTAGSVDVNLPPDAGTYYIVLSNTFSLLSSKNVQINASLTYYQ